MTKISMVKSSGRFAPKITNTDSVFASVSNQHHSLNTNKIEVLNLNQTLIQPTYQNNPQTVIINPLTQHPLPSASTFPPRSNQDTWVKRYCPWILLVIGSVIMLGVLAALVVSLAKKDSQVALKSLTRVNKAEVIENKRINLLNNNKFFQDNVIDPIVAQPTKQKEREMTSSQNNIGMSSFRSDKTQNTENERKPQVQVILPTPKSEEYAVTKTSLTNDSKSNKSVEKQSISSSAVHLLPVTVHKLEKSSLPITMSRIEAIPSRTRPYKKSITSITVSEQYKNLVNEEEKEQDAKTELTSLPKHLKRYHN